MTLKKRLSVEICMGSSCFARGNGDHVKMIQQYGRDHAETIDVVLKGSLCQGRCSQGPSVVINGISYSHIDSTTLLDLLKHHAGVQA